MPRGEGMRESSGIGEVVDFYGGDYAPQILRKRLSKWLDQISNTDILPSTGKPDVFVIS